MSKKPTQIQQSQASSSGSPTLGEPEFLAVGKLRRPHGIHGEMLMVIWTDFPERLIPGKLVFVGNSHQPLHIKKVRGHEQNPLISFNEHSTREEVGQYRNQIVFVRASDLPPLPDDEVYIHQLLGMQVISNQGGDALGLVAEILETGANLVFVVRKDGRRDILIPDIEPVILNIDLVEREILVQLIPGLISDD